MENPHKSEKQTCVCVCVCVCVCLFIYATVFNRVFHFSVFVHFFNKSFKNLLNVLMKIIFVK